ncbi:MAG: class I SAM-dependent methyltransferase [Cyanobacteriota bacterium]|nr:class I SAM-dependent methyltransferase [Cyanobacteriota bacterium]
MDDVQSAAAAREPVTAAVARLYDTYPFPPEPLLDEPPPGYNWRWYWPTVHSFCTGASPRDGQVRVLDAGCGTGVSTEYLAHLNPAATVLGIDLSGQALATATERCRRSQATNASFRRLSLYDVDQLPGSFDWINCVGVLHHLPDPRAGLQALASKLAPGGVIHLFVYAAIGRWEISLMQQAIALVQGDRRGDYRDGVAVGRQLFASLPPENRLKQREQQRWSLENQRDECFADMYVHPQEVDYTTDMLVDLIQASGLEFVGFSNPSVWRLDRLLGADPALLQRAEALPEWDRYRLISLLDPEITHFEWFLAKPPRRRWDWNQDGPLLAARVERNPCMEGWPSQRIFNHNYEIVTLSEVEFEVLQACDRANSTPGPGTDQPPGIRGTDILAATQASLMDLRRMQEQQLILLHPLDSCPS